MKSFLANDNSFLCKVVINKESQYSIWPLTSENPLGWSDAGFQGSKQSCLQYIEKVWTTIV
ncbi:MAG: MbtH family protein [Pseudomonadota bacterium]